MPESLMGRPKSMVLASLFVLLLGPIGLFYVRMRYGLIGAGLLAAAIILPYALFYLSLRLGWEGLVVFAL